MHVLLDTNIYLSDLTFSKPEFEALRNYLRKTDHCILLPEIVEKEIDKKISNIAYDEVGKIFNLKSTQLKLLKQVPKREDIEKAIKSNLDKNVFSKRITKKIPSDKMPLSDLINRSLQEMPPFKNQGRGFRDALIWYNLINYLKDNNKDYVAFISNNSLDFGEDNLKNELLDEVKELKIDDRLHYFNSLADFLTKFGGPIEFINEEFINENIRDIAEAYAGSIDPGALEIGETKLSQGYDVENVIYEDFQVLNFYVYESTKDHYWIYAEVALNFYVQLSNMEYSFSPYSGEWDWYLLEDNTSGWDFAEFKLKIDKSSKQATEVDHF
jgi:hypothetical protein